MFQNAAERIVSDHLRRAGIEIGGARPWDIQVHDGRFFDRVARKGALGAGESYMDGEWDCTQLDEMAARVMKRDFLYGLGNGIRFLLYWARSTLLDLQRGKGGRAVAQRHYDLGNDMFEAMLGPTMMYSCAYWRSASDLEAAQEAKMRLICDKLQLEKGARVLDVGCGWGGFAKFAAENYGCEVFAITISEEQARYASEFCGQLPVEVALLDYRDPSLKQYGPFDRITAIGMFEHVGPTNYGRFMRICRDVMVDDGLTLIQTFGRMRSRAVDPWVTHYIFPNSYVPSLSEIDKAIKGHLVLEDLHSFGADYDRTLMAWHQRFEGWASSQWRQANATQYRMWRYYLLTFAGCFRARSRTQLWQLVMSKDGVPGGYRSVR